VLITAVFTIVKLSKQLKCPTTDEENVVYIHSEVLFSHKEKGNCDIFRYMNGTVEHD
jgi:hypothetical protein